MRRIAHVYPPDPLPSTHIVKVALYFPAHDYKEVIDQSSKTGHSFQPVSDRNLFPSPLLSEKPCQAKNQPAQEAQHPLMDGIRILPGKTNALIVESHGPYPVNPKTAKQNVTGETQ